MADLGRRVGLVGFRWGFWRNFGTRRGLGGCTSSRWGRGGITLLFLERTKTNWYPSAPLPVNRQKPCWRAAFQSCFCRTARSASVGSRWGDREDPGSCGWKWTTLGFRGRCPGSPPSRKPECFRVEVNRIFLCTSQTYFGHFVSNFCRNNPAAPKKYFDLPESRHSRMPK